MESALTKLRSRRKGMDERVLRRMVFRGKDRRMFSPNRFQVLFLARVLAALLLFAPSCGGSKANVRRDDATAAALPAAVDVTTAPAIMRDLPDRKSVV